MYLHLDELKKQINIDCFYSGDDEYIVSLAEAAEGALEKHLNVKLSLLEDEDGNLPEALKGAMKMLVAQWYNSREAVSYNINVNEIPLGYRYILELYQNYDWHKG